MDRTIAYSSALPRSADFLQAQKDAVYGLGYLAQAILGTTTSVDGLACAPTAPASLQVTIGVGSIYPVEEMDATAYGVLGTDTNTLVKQGRLLSPATLIISPPSTSGYSQVFLIEAEYGDLDGGSTVLPYYDSVSPSIPFSGPGNSGTAQYTIRQGLCVIALKAGAAAPTGTQVTPTPDVGYVGLYTITVANGQTSITSANIATYANAPFITPKLPAVPAAIQAQAANYAVDSGSANAMAITLPSYTSVVSGLRLSVRKGSSANTSSGVTLSVNGGAAYAVLWADGSALASGDWPGGCIGNIVFSGSNWQVDSLPGPSVFARNSPSVPTVIDQALVHYGTDTGALGANSIQVTAVSPTPVGSVVAGFQFEIVKTSVPNTTGMTATILGITGSVLWPDGSALQSGDWPASATAVLEYDGLNFRLMSIMGPTVYARVSSVKSLHCGTDVGTANAAVVSSVSPAVTTVASGMQFEVTKGAATNTGAMTATICGTSGPVRWNDGSPLIAGDWGTGDPAIMFFDGTNFNITSVGGPTVWKRAGWLPPYALFHKVRTRNIGPVSCPLNTWMVWEHNTTIINTIPGCVLQADGSVILPPGTYKVTFGGVVWNGAHHWCRMWNCDDLVEIAWGLACATYIGGPYPCGLPSTGTGFFTIPNDDHYGHGGFGGRRCCHHHICYGFAGPFRGIDVIGYDTMRDAWMEYEKLA